MKILTIEPLKSEQLAEVVELDQICFGGLWTKEGYQRELDSPSSTLLVLSLKQQMRKGGENGQALKQTQGVDMGMTQVLFSDLPSLTRHNPSSRDSPSAEKTCQLLNTQAKISHSQTQIVGIGCFWAIVEEAHITLIGIHPDYQKQGLGQLMLYTLLQQAVECKLERATLEVRASNQPALSLYKKFGFHLAGKRKRYYQKTGEDALILWLGELNQPQFKQKLSEWKKQINECLNPN